MREGTEQVTRNSQTRVGIIVPSSNTVVELDFQRMNLGHLSTHFARAFLAETTAAAERVMIEDHVPQAAIDLGSAKVELVAFACTSAAAVVGVEGENALIERLSALASAQVVSTNNAVAQRLQAESAGKVAILTAYVEELNRAIAAGLRERGVDVAMIDGMAITDNFAIADVTPTDIVEYAVDRLEGQDFDTLFISCTNLRAIEAMEDLESRFGRPVVTSNSATIDAILTAVGS
jgi:maleate isomerase